MFDNKNYSNVLTGVFIEIQRGNHNIDSILANVANGIMGDEMYSPSNTIKREEEIELLINSMVYARQLVDFHKKAEQ